MSVSRSTWRAFIGTGASGIQCVPPLAESAERFWAEPRARRAEFEAHPERVREILADGASRAQRAAQQVIGESSFVND